MAVNRSDVNVSSSGTSSSSKCPAEKPKGILKYLGCNTDLPTNAKGEQELVTLDRSSTLSTNEASQSVIDTVDDGIRPHNPFEELDGDIDLEMVNVDEQRHILEGIYRSRQGQSAHSSSQPAKRSRKQGHSVGSTKRAREQPNVSQPKQPRIGAYFQARDKA